MCLNQLAYAYDKVHYFLRGESSYFTWMDLATLLTQDVYIAFKGGIATKAK